MKDIKKVSLALILLLFTPIQAAFYTVEVKGFVCALCGQGVEKRLQKISNNKIENYAVDMDTQIITFEVNNEVELKSEDIKQAITKAGYAVVNLKKEDQKKVESEDQSKPKQQTKKQKKQEQQHNHKHEDMKKHQH